MTTARRLVKARRYPFKGWAPLACLVGLAFITSCTVVKHETAATKSVFQSLTGSASDTSRTNALAALQSEVMREADQYVGALAQATDDFRKTVPTIEARDLAQQWKLNEAMVAYVNATDENPLLGAVGMVVLSSLSRLVVEDYWVERFGESVRPLLETHRQAESNAWTLVQTVLTTNQQEELRKLITAYREKNPHIRYVSAVRLPELVTSLGPVPTPEQTQKPGSLFSLLYINPLAGLDPTTQAIQQTRMLAQRMMYYAQRAPMLLSWQVELTTYQLAAQPESRELLSDVNDVGESTKVFAQTAAQLPKLINDQRQAAINQLFAGIATERTNIIADLVAQETTMGKMLPEVRQTLTAGGQMAESLNAAIQSLNTFIRYVDPPDTNSPVTPPDTNSPPFNILDYGTAASQIGVAADKLNNVIVSLNQSLPEVNKLSQQGAAEAKDVVSHAFRLGLVLIAFLGLVIFLVVLACRRFAPAGK